MASRRSQRSAAAAHVSGGRGAQDEALAILLGLDFLQAIELSDQRAPFGFHARGGEAVFERLAQHERQERAEHVAANGGVLLMINRSGVENGLGRSEDVLDF